LLGEKAHEDEERHRGEQLLLHHPDGLEVGEVEHRVPAQTEIAEREREEQQREADREADEDRTDHHGQHDEAEKFAARHTSTFSFCSSSIPVRAADRLFRSSEMPWMSSSRIASGTTILNGHRIGRQGVCSEVSPIVNAYQPSFQLMKKN